MNHEIKINRLLRDVFHEDWMNDSDYNQTLNNVFKQTGISKQMISNDIEKGIKNGYSIECQIKLAKSCLLQINLINPDVCSQFINKIILK